MQIEDKINLSSINAKTISTYDGFTGSNNLATVQMPIPIDSSNLRM
jgi:hypothetical protein